MEYFIKDTETPDGPYDMMAIIRKLRNGSVVEDTLIANTVFEEPRPASSFPEFQDFFREEAEAEEGVHEPRPAPSFGALLRTGIGFLKQNHFAAVYSGLFMIIWLLLAMMLMVQQSVILSLAAIGGSYFFMGGYLYGILRFVRGNPVNFPLILGIILSTAVNMGVVSIVLAAVMFPGVLLVDMLGPDMLAISMPVLFIFLLVALTFLAFAPLLITDRKRDFWDAMLGSVRIVMCHKGQNLGNIFGLVALNFLLFPLMPIVLPLTMGALVDLYDGYVE